MVADCPFCGALFQSREDLREHISRSHSDGKDRNNEDRRWMCGKPGWKH